MEEGIMHFETPYCHCSECYTNGANSVRWLFTHSYAGGHTWETTFPCRKSAEEYKDAFLPFITPDWKIEKLFE